MLLSFEVSKVNAQMYTFEADSMIRITQYDSVSDLRKMNLYIEIAWELRNYKPDVAIQYGMRAVEFATKLEEPLALVKAYSFTGVCHRNLGNYSDALDYYQLALKNSKKYGIKGEEAYCYINFGNIYLYQEDYSSALETVQKALPLARELADSSVLGYAYLNLGRAYAGLKKYVEAEDYLRMSLIVREKSNAPLSQRVTVEKYIGDIYSDRQQYDIAKNIYVNCYKKANESERDLTADLTAKLSYIYYKKQMYDSALFFGYRSLEISKEIGTKFRIRNAYNAVADVCFAQKNYLGAATNYYNQIVYSDSIFNELLTQKLYNVQFSAERKRKQLRTEIIALEQENRQVSKVMIIAVSSAVVITVFLAVLFLRRFHFLKKAGKEKDNVIYTVLNTLEEKNKLLKKDELLLEKYRKDLNFVWQLSAAAQKLLREKKNENGNFFSESFVLNMPKGISGGDFFWNFEDEKYGIIVVADCTGHEVEGTIISMLGIAALQEIVLDGLRGASQISSRLRSAFNRALNNENGTSKELSRCGMDLALIVINKETKILDFSGSNIPLYYVRDSHLYKLNADRNHIGGHLRQRDFESQFLQLSSGDCLYVFTDGYYSQFGGKNNQMFRLENLKNILLSNYLKPMNLQREILEKTFMEFKGENNQIDDILIAGFRL